MMNQTQVKQWITGIVIGVISGAIAYIYFSNNLVIVLSIAAVYLSDGVLYSNKETRNAIRDLPKATTLRLSGFFALFSFIMFPSALFSTGSLGNNLFDIFLIWLLGISLFIFAFGTMMKFDLSDK